MTQSSLLALAKGLWPDDERCIRQARSGRATAIPGRPLLAVKNRPSDCDGCPLTSKNLSFGLEVPVFNGHRQVRRRPRAPAPDPKQSLG